jgi:hypothetical protein
LAHAHRWAQHGLNTGEKITGRHSAGPLRVQPAQPDTTGSGTERRSSCSRRFPRMASADVASVAGWPDLRLCGLRSPPRMDPV